MKKYFEMLCFLMFVFLVCSCASQPVFPPCEWPYEKRAIHLHLKADTRLNFYDGEPHTLVLCVYQLKDRIAFDQLTEDDDGLRELLECGRFDTASVAGCKRWFVQPGEEMIYSLDRAEGTKYVAIVAGYYLLQEEGIVRLYDVPCFVEEKGFIRRTMVAKPGPLDIDLVLGLDQIQRSGETLGI